MAAVPEGAAAISIFLWPRAPAHRVQGERTNEMMTVVVQPLSDRGIEDRGPDTRVIEATVKAPRNGRITVGCSM